MTILIGLLLVSLFFLAFPGADIWASGLFYAPGEGFWVKTVPFFIRIRELGPFLVKLVAAACLVILLLKLIVPYRKALVDLRWPLYLLSTLILGPGLIVNGLLKNNWGRPRPWMVEQFGGEFPYVPVWEITDYCQRNCSFVSGEGSASAWFLSLAFLVPVLWRRPAVVAIVTFMIVMSLNRIAFGGHFLSDTLLSWGITLLVMRVSYWVFFTHPPQFLTSDYLEAAFSRIGEKLNTATRKVLGRSGYLLTSFFSKFSR
ncbi:MAG: phosphatase PAP2 family protein [Stappiaceae bacterium]